MTLNSITQKQNYTRIQLLDFIRGIAILLMFIFHISFGLSEIGILDINFSKEYFWIAFRALIVFLFLTLVGIGLVLSENSDSNQNQSFFNRLFFSKRLLLLFFYMMSITALSYYARPHSFVYFGILHLIFVASIIGRLILITSIGLLGLVTIFSLLLGLTFESSHMNYDLIYWLGLGNKSPISDDFAPFFPWFSLVVLGIILGKYLVSKNSLITKLSSWQSKNWISSLLSWAGKYSIHLYFIHFQFFYLLVLFSKF